MKAQKMFFVGLCVASQWVSAQDVQSTPDAASGGNGAGVTTNHGENTFYGTKAGAASRTNVHDTYIGHFSGATSDSALDNVAVGAYSGSSVKKSSNNVYVGSRAGFSNDASLGSNVMVGFAAGHENDRGNQNVFLGNEAGFKSHGTGNVFIGNEAGHDEDSGSNLLYIANTATDTPLVYGNFRQNKLGVGGFNNFPSLSGAADVSSYTLFVKGGILTEEVRVSPNATWADYVFTPEYKLPTLAEVEQYIKSEGHLMNVPSAKEIQADGIGLGEMATIQQEKIEEMTLYIIEQNKINEQQGKEIEMLKQQVLLLMQRKN